MSRLLFVGITRATKWVYLSATQGAEIPAIAKLRPLQPQGMLTIQEGAGQPVEKQREAGESQGGGDLLNLL